MGAPRTVGARELFQEPGFRRLFSARVVSLFGSAIAPTALAFAILGIPGSTVRDLGLVVGAHSLARVFFLLFGGVFADRLGKVRVIIGSDLVAGLAQGGIAALVLRGTPSLALLTALSALSGAAAALFLPASSGIIPEILPDVELQSANSLLRLSTNASMIVGAAAAGALVAFVGSGGALLLDALTFLVSALVLLGLKTPPPKRRERETVIAELRQGWEEFASRQWLWVVVLQFAIVNACFQSGFAILGPSVAKARFSGALSWSLITAAQSAGLVLGGFFGGRLRPRHPLRAATYAALVIGLPLLTLGLLSSALVVAASAAVQGASLSVFSVLWDTTLQTHVSKEKLARVYAYDWLGSLGLVPVFQAAVGPLAATIGVPRTLVLECALIVAVGLAALCSSSVRDLERSA